MVMGHSAQETGGKTMATTMTDFLVQAVTFGLLGMDGMRPLT
jgi:hypothetical protein